MEGGGGYDSLGPFLLVSTPQNPIAFCHIPSISISNEFGRGWEGYRVSNEEIQAEAGLNCLLKVTKLSSPSGNQWA
jgi:hypothetical protein